MGYTENSEITCEAHPELLQYIENDARNLEYIKRRTGKEIKLVANPELAVHDYQISTDFKP